MASAAVQSPNIPSEFGSIDSERLTTAVNIDNTLLNGPRDLIASLNYYKAPEDGSAPHPTYIDRPETFDRPFESHTVSVHDVSGHENEYTLDKNGFQFYRHSAAEKEFLDDEQIKAVYYPDVERLLKDV
jgi:hypothetical protein